MSLYNLRSRSVMGSDDIIPLSEEVRAYFENLVSPLVKTQQLNDCLEDFKKEVLGRIGDLEDKLTEKEKIIDESAKTIARLDSELKIVRNALDLVKRHADDNEQYSRRCSLRVNGVPVKDSENVKEILKDCYQHVGVEFDASDIDRAHRVGKATFDKSKKIMTQPILVKYKCWDSKLRFYKARPKFEGKSRGGKPVARRFTVSSDLTTRRYNLLKYARETLASGNYDVKYVFADVNCSLAVRLPNDNLRFFETKENFHKLIGFKEDDHDD